VPMTEIHSMIHKLVEMVKRVPSIFMMFEGKKVASFEQAIDRRPEGYLCRMLDLKGNKVECFINKGLLEMAFGVILTSIYPPRFFNSCVFSSKISNYSLFRFNYLRSSFDNLGFVVKDYGVLLNCFSHVQTKFSLAMDDSGAHYTGSLNGSEYEHGLIFDRFLNYFTYSNSFQYQGYIRHLENDVTYYGGLRNKLPSGNGMILIASRPVFIGNFINGVPSGHGFYFSKREELEFFGSFHSRPLFGVYSKNYQYYEGVFKVIPDRETMIDFEKNPITMNNLKECKKLHQEFQDFIVSGICRHYSQRIFEISGEIIFGSKQLTGRFVVKYMNGALYHGLMQNGSRLGMGYFATPEGSFKLFGLFNGESSVKGYLLIQHALENSVKSQKVDNILIPQMIFGDILYDSNGKLHVKGMAKVLFTNGSVYYGQFCNNSITGYGRLYKKDDQDSVYTGQIYYGKQFGLGQLKTKTFTYEGQFSNDQFHGYGKLQREGITVKGYWTNGLCQYATLHFFASERCLGFNTMSILFATPTIEFSAQSLEGYVELYFDKSTGQTLAEVYEALNQDVKQENRIEFRTEERRKSVDQSQLAKFNSVPRKRKMSFQALENSTSSIKSKSKKVLEKNPNYPPQVNTSLRRLGSQTRLNPASLKAETSIMHSKAFKISNFTFQKSLSRQYSKFLVNPPRTNNSLNSSMVLDMEEQYEKIYCFVGRCSTANGGTFIGEIRKHDEVFGVLETDKRFLHGVCFYHNTAGTEETLGKVTNFRITGEAMKITTAKRLMGYFQNSKPEGLIIKSRPPKEDYIGVFKAGKKHGFGMKVCKDERGRQVTFLFNFLKGELRSLAKISAEEEAERTPKA
jgi:hypothetical protein